MTCRIFIYVVKKLKIQRKQSPKLIHSNNEMYLSQKSRHCHCRFCMSAVIILFFWSLWECDLLLSCKLQDSSALICSTNRTPTICKEQLQVLGTQWWVNRSDLFFQRACILVKLTFLCIHLRNIYFDQKEVRVVYFLNTSVWYRKI